PGGRRPRPDGAVSLVVGGAGGGRTVPGGARRPALEAEQLADGAHVGHRLVPARPNEADGEAQTEGAPEPAAAGPGGAGGRAPGARRAFSAATGRSPLVCTHAVAASFLAPFDCPVTAESLSVVPSPPGIRPGSVMVL